MIWVWRNAAVVLAVKGIDGWGWFLFVAVLAGSKPAESRDA